MTRKKLIIAACFSSIVAGALAGEAVAQSSNFYLGAGLGRSTNKFNSTDFAFNTPGVSESQDQYDTGYKLFGGYKFNQNWGAELGYSNLGKFAWKASSIAGTARADYKTSAWSLAAVGTLPISGAFSVFGKLGATYNEARLSVSGTGALVAGINGISSKKNKTDLLWGLGVNYAITPAVGLRLEYEDYGKFGNAWNNIGDSGRAKDSLWSLNLTYRF